MILREDFLVGQMVTNSLPETTILRSLKVGKTIGGSNHPFSGYIC